MSAIALRTGTLPSNKSVQSLIVVIAGDAIVQRLRNHLPLPPRVASLLTDAMPSYLRSLEFLGPITTATSPDAL